MKNYEILLKTLMNGQKINFNENNYVLSEDNQLCVEYKATNLNTQKEEISYIPLQCDTLKFLLDISEKIKFETLFIMNANNVLNKH